MKKFFELIKKNIGMIFPCIWTALGALYNVWYQAVPGKWILDSDLAAEMVLSNHLNQTHRIISQDWYYSTELRVFESQWFYRIGLLISPNNWHVARIVAVILLYCAFIAVILFFARNIGLGKYAPWLSAVLMWPFGRWYLVYGLYGTYYLIYMMFSMAVAGILFKLFRLSEKKERTRKENIERSVLYTLGVFLSIASGLNGIKQAMSFYAPLVLSAFVVLMIASYKLNVGKLSELFGKCRAITIFFLNSLLFTVFNVAGYLINSKILSRKYQYWSYEDMVFSENSVNRFYDVILDFLKLFGYSGDVKVISAAGIISALGILFAIILVVCASFMNKRIMKLKMEEAVITLIFDTTLLIDGLVFCLIGSYKNYYWLSLFPFAAAIIILELTSEEIKLLRIRKIALTGVALILPVLSIGAVKRETERPLFATKGYQELTQYLLEHNYLEGYASFWNSAVLREMSNGQIQTWSLYNVNENVVVYKWLQETEKSVTEPEGQCFLIINEERDGRAEDSALVKYGSGELVYEDGLLHVYLFQGAGEIQDAVENSLSFLDY